MDFPRSRPDRPHPAPADPRVRRRQVGWIIGGLALLAALAVVVPVAVLRWSPAPAAPGAGDRNGAGPAASGVIGAGASKQRESGSCAGRPLTAERELRGMWLTTVNNIDWPSRPGLDAATVRAEYRSWLDLAQRMRHNAVFVHVRPSGDAFWPSAYAPWSEWLTGRRDGRGPGWDPLEFMVTEAHARNLEFHAWFNPYRASQPAPEGAGGDIKRLAPTHPLRKHPQWAVAYPKKAAGSRLYYDPGIPEARRFVEDSILDAVNRYDLDGVHFDDFFYPYRAAGQDFGDDASFASFGKGFASRADWRRDNVNRFVREMNQRIKDSKPWVKFGISPFGIWRNQKTDPRGSATRGMQSYDTIYADTRLWVREQWLDYVVPQLYWHIGFDIADYAKLLPWWARTVAGTRVQLYIGQADYRIGEKGAWRDPSQLDRQLSLNQRYGVTGSVHFSAKQVRANRLGAVDRYVAAHYAAPALLPRMGHLPANVPATPVLTGVGSAAARKAAKQGAGKQGAGKQGAGKQGAGKQGAGQAVSADRALAVTWRPGTGIPATSFAVYRVDQSVRGGNATLVATLRNDGAAAQTWTDRALAPGRRYAYCVAALDRLGAQSLPSAAIEAG